MEEKPDMNEFIPCPECGELMPIWEEYNCSYCQMLNILEEEKNENPTT